MIWSNLGALGVGGVLLSVPIIIHFLMQPKPVSIDFPALRFLKQRQKTTRSRMRLKHFLLLAIRCLLIALVAIALAGPAVASNTFGSWLTLGGVGFSALIVGGVAWLAAIRSKPNWTLVGVLGFLFVGHLIYGVFAGLRLANSESADLIGEDQAPVAALIVIDSSPRMELRFENQTRLEKASEIGTWLVSQFPAESQVCVTFTDGLPPFFSADTAAAGRRLEDIQTNYTGAKLPNTLMESLKILEDSPLERKEVYVISDLTRESWLGENAGRLAKRLDRNQEYSVFLIDVGVPLPSNYALGDLHLSTSEISESGTITLDSRVLKTGEAGPATVQLKVEKIDRTRPIVRDGETVVPDSYFPTQVVNKELAAEGTADFQFSLNGQFEKGTYHGTLELETGDGLEVDNQRFFTFRVSDTHDVLIVHPNNIDPRILVSLLAPQDAVERGATRYNCSVILQSELGSPDIELGDYEAVFFLDPQPLSDGIWERLIAYAQAGGGVGLFLGHNINQQGSIDASFVSESAKKAIGGELDVLWFHDDDKVAISPAELSHPVFRPIVGYETSMLWHRHPIAKHWGMQVDGDNEEFPTQTIVRFSNREPALVERVIGLGRIVTMTTPISEYSSNENRRIWNRLFSVTPVPVPGYLLTLGIAEYLVQTDADSLNVRVGESAIFRNDLRDYPEAYKVFSPELDKSPTQLNSVDGRIRFRFNDAPGHYRMRGIMDQQAVLRGFSSNLEVAATDLSRVQPDQLDEFLGAERYQLATQISEIERQQGKTRRGQEFYPLLVVMMLVILAVEYLMSNRFYT